MATPRSQLVDPEAPLVYHIVSRCVRRAWLCGTDAGQNYDHRKVWLESRLIRLSAAFAVELYGYAIMSNHFHLILRYDPSAATQWTDEEVVDRWLDCCRLSLEPDTNESDAQLELMRLQLMANKPKLERIRRQLGSLSSFMKHLKQPIAWRANREDNCKGHFFEGRFYSGALLDDTAVISALAYVDLNPVRAKMVRRAVEASYTSLSRRLDALAADPARLDKYLAPIVSGLADSTNQSKLTLPITLSAYLEYLEQFSLSDETTIDKAQSWYQRVAMFKRHQRAYGFGENIRKWAIQRGWSRLGVATPV